MFEGWKYQKIFDHFQKICEIPHGSYHEEALSEYVYQFALSQGYTAMRDTCHNVLVRIPASEGREQEPSYLFQGHLDMVCEKEADISHDFLKDPIKIHSEEDWLMAEGTTLGGDDGIAVAYMLALMEEASQISHPSLELLMTSAEEVGMDGAKALDPLWIQARRMINLDSEKEGEFIVGGAGGMRVEVHHPLQRTSVPEGYLPVEVKVSGLRGGHSGEDIHKQRGNANVILGKYLFGWYNHCPDTLMVSLNGGSKDNAIPREATARIWIPESLYEHAQRGCWWFGEDLAKEYAESDPGALITMRIADPSVESGWQCLPMNSDVTGEVVNFLHLCPNGVRSMGKDFGGIVESSQNIAVLCTEEDDWYCRISMRSNRSELLSNMLNRIRIMAEMSGMNCIKGSEYPAWDYKKESPLRDQLYHVFQQMYGTDPEIRILHAGLECGILASKIPNMDIVSMGPNMENVHSPRERLSISSVQRVWEFLVHFLEERKE